MMRADRKAIYEMVCKQVHLLPWHIQLRTSHSLPKLASARAHL
jgi:hypothetical protein